MASVKFKKYIYIRVNKRFHPTKIIFIFSIGRINLFFDSSFKLGMNGTSPKRTVRLVPLPLLLTWQHTRKRQPNKTVPRHSQDPRTIPLLLLLSSKTGRSSKFFSSDIVILCGSNTAFGMGWPKVALLTSACGPRWA